jgi:hypothetical protein
VHSLGTVMLNHELFKKERKATAVQMFGNLLAHVTKVVSAAVKVKTLYDQVQKLIPDKLPDL